MPTPFEQAIFGDGVQKRYFDPTANLITIWGGDPTGTLPSSLAIENAIAALPAQGGSIVFPPGTYILERPIRIARSNVHLTGVDMGGSQLRTNQVWTGNLLTVAPPASVPVLGTSLATGAGQSFRIDSIANQPGRFNAMDHFGLQKVVNGLSSFCLEYFLNMDPASTGGGIVGAQGSLDGALVSPMTIYAADLGGPVRVLKGAATFSGSGLQTITSSAVSTNATHHAALTFDGTNLRFFVDGVLQGTINAAGQTLVWPFFADFWIGVASNSWPESDASAAVCKSLVDSIRISNTARYTSGFTPPTAKLTADNNTIFLCNFDGFSSDWRTLTCSAVNYNGPGAILPAYLTNRDVSSGGCGQVDLSYLQFNGVDSVAAGRWINSADCRMDNVTFGGVSNGLGLQNCQNIILNRMIISSSNTTSRQGYSAISAGLNELFDVQVVGHAVGFVARGSATNFFNCQWLNNSVGQYGLIFGTGGGFDIMNLTLFAHDNETFAPNMKASLFIDGFVTVNLFGCAVDTSINNPLPAIRITPPGGSFLCLYGCKGKVGAGATEVIHFTSANGASDKVASIGYLSAGGTSVLTTSGTVTTVV